MIRSTTEGNKINFRDQSDLLTKDELAMVQVAMGAGFTEFTTPTPKDDDGRIDWRVRRWLTVKNGRPMAFLVAYKELNAHFEVLGPEISLAKTETQLQKR